MNLLMAIFFAFFGGAFCLIGIAAIVGLNIAGIYVLFVGCVQLWLATHLATKGVR